MTVQAPRIALQAGAQGAGRLVALLLNLVTFAVLLGQLTPTEFGHFALVSALEYVAGTLAAFGIDTVVFRRLSLGEMSAEDLGAALQLRVLLAGLTAVVSVALVVALPLSASLSTALYVGIAGQALAPLATMQQVLRARVDLVPFAVADIAGSLITLCTLLVLSVDGLTAADAVASVIAANAVVWSGLAIRAWRLQRPAFTRRGLGERIRSLVRESRLIAAADALVVVYYRADIIALGVVVGGAAVGIYGATYRFVDVTMYAQAILIGAFFPTIARAWAGPDRLAILLRRLATVLFTVAALAMVLVVCFGSAVISYFGGEDYGDITGVASILMTGTAVMFLNRLLTQTLIAGGHPGRQLWCWSGGLVGAVVAFPLAAQFEAVGAAVAMLGGETLVLIIAWRQLARVGVRIRCMPTPAVWGAAGAMTASLAIPLLPVVPGIVVGVALSLAIGTVAVMSLKAVRAHEI